MIGFNPRPMAGLGLLSVRPLADLTSGRGRYPCSFFKSGREGNTILFLKTVLAKIEKPFANVLLDFFEHLALPLISFR